MVRRKELTVGFAAGFAFCYIFVVRDVGPPEVVTGTTAHDVSRVARAAGAANAAVVTTKVLPPPEPVTRDAALLARMSRNDKLRAKIEALEAGLVQKEPASIASIANVEPTVVPDLATGAGAGRTAAAMREPPPPAVVGVGEGGRWPSANRLCRGCKNQEYIDGNPLWSQPATSKAQFCALIPATSKPKYKKFLEIMAATIGRNADVNAWLLFNAGDASEPADSETYEMCDELAASGPRMRCLIVNVSTSGRPCPVGRKCAAAVIFEGSKVIGQDLLASCDWVIKLDPDCVFIPNAAKEFVRKVSPQRKVFYGTFSGNLVYSGWDNIWLRTQMPQGNWMVSIATWKRMQETTQLGICSPNHQYAATDEAAALLCSWYSWGADCVTNWRKFVRIGPAAETPQSLQAHVDRVKIGGRYGHHECVMLVHKYTLDDMTTLYHDLQALRHRDREGCGLDGAELQNSLDYEYNRPAVGGFKFPNKTAIDSVYDCTDPSKLKDTGIREPPPYIVEAGHNYAGPTGSEAREKFKDLPERPRNFTNIKH